MSMSSAAATVRSRFAGWRERLAPLLDADWRGVPLPILFIIGYFICQAVLLTLTRDGASFDGAEQLITSQSFEWGYGRSQPPIYTWLLIAIEMLVPAPLAAEHILKAALFIIGYSALYATARAVGLSRAAATLAMAATFLMPEIGWQAQTAYTHSTLVFATGSLLLYSFVRLDARSGFATHAIFGALAALALLSKFSAGFLIAAMLVALLVAGQLKAIFWRRQALAGLVVFVAVLAPHLIWSLMHLEQLFALKSRFALDAYDNPLVARIVGLGTYLSSIAIFIGPLAVVYALAAGWPWRPIRPLREGEQLLAVMFVAGLAIMALTPILSGASDFAPRWPLAAVFPYGLIVAIYLDRIRPDRVAAVALIALAVAFAYVPIMNIRSSLPGSRSENDYAALLAAIEQRAGPVSSVVIADYPILANLRIARPSLRLIMPAFPFTERYLDKSTVYLWTGAPAIPGVVRKQMREAGRDPAGMIQTTVLIEDTFGDATKTDVHVAY